VNCVVRAGGGGSGGSIWITAFEWDSASSGKLTANGGDGAYTDRCALLTTPLVYHACPSPSLFMLAAFDCVQASSPRQP